MVEANLEEANLTGATISDADFIGANLRDAVALCVMVGAIVMVMI
ncbi:MAG: pentapeptide repeat-containing protein [Anaerolineae bacterium]|nr:pentapeptide repeat-containing protein [Anaerolineae bacterium]